jgi:hypothetical protein
VSNQAQLWFCIITLSSFLIHCSPKVSLRTRTSYVLQQQHCAAVQSSCFLPEYNSTFPLPKAGWLAWLAGWLADDELVTYVIMQLSRM